MRWVRCFETSASSDLLSAGRQRTSTERSEVDERATGVARLPLEPADVPVVSVKFRTLISGVPAVVVLGRSVDVRRTYPRRPDWMP